MFEKFKEDIREYNEDYLDEDNLWRSRNDKFEVIKQSYLNAIDVMVEKVSTPVLPEHKETELYKYLKEQRKLIENYE